MRKQLGTLALSLVLGLGFIGASAPAVAAATPNVWDFTCGAPTSWCSSGVTFVSGDVLTISSYITGTSTGNNIQTNAVLNNGSSLAALSNAFLCGAFSSIATYGTCTRSTTLSGAAWSSWMRFFTNTPNADYVAHFHLIITAGPSYVPVFNGDCVNGFVHNPHTQYGLVSPGAHEGVSGDAFARLLYPCVLKPGDVIGYSGFSWVLPANLGSASNFVQLGYGQTDCNASPCLEGLPDDGVPHFIFTLTDNAGGVTATWATFFQGGTPTLGHQYRFSITPLKIRSTRFWNYCIQDLSPQTPGIGCDNLTQQTWSVGAASWFFEAQRTTDALGVGVGDAPILLSNMRYRDGATWTQQTGICSGYQSPEPYYACDTTTTTIPNDTFSAYTFAH